MVEVVEFSASDFVGQILLWSAVVAVPVGIVVAVILWRVRAVRTSGVVLGALLSAALAGGIGFAVFSRSIPEHMSLAHTQEGVEEFYDMWFPEELNAREVIPSSDGTRIVESATRADWRIMHRVRVVREDDMVTLWVPEDASVPDSQYVQVDHQWEVASSVGRSEAG